MELVIWGLLVGMVGMVWFLAAAALMEREHHSEDHDPPKTNPEHHDHAPHIDSQSKTGGRLIELTVRDLFYMGVLLQTEGDMR